MESVKTIPLSSIAENPISPPARSVESEVAMPWLVQPIGRCPATMKVVASDNQDGWLAPGSAGGWA